MDNQSRIIKTLCFLLRVDPNSIDTRNRNWLDSRVLQLVESGDLPADVSTDSLIHAAESMTGETFNCDTYAGYVVVGPMSAAPYSIYVVEATILVSTMSTNYWRLRGNELDNLKWVPQCRCFSDRQKAIIDANRVRIKTIAEAEEAIARHQTNIETEKERIKALESFVVTDVSIPPWLKAG